MSNRRNIANGSMGRLRGALVLAVVAVSLFLTGVIDISAAVWGGGSTKPSGTGTQSNPYIVNSAETLAGLSMVSDKSDVYISITADIVLNENVLTADYELNAGSFLEWTPLEGFSNINVEGGGHTISGLYLNGNYTTAGLFLTLPDNSLNTFNNLHIVDSYLHTSYSNCVGIGSFAGCTTNRLASFVMTGCSFEGHVSGSTQVGGLLAANGGSGTRKGHLTDCYVCGRIVGGGSAKWTSVGGLVGVSYYSDATACVNYAGVTCTAGNSVGGLFGNSCHGDLVIGCVNYGEVNGIGEVGGISGETNGSVVHRGCINFGNVTGDNKVGGIVGNNHRGEEKDYALVESNWAKTEGCVNYGRVVGNNSVGGIVGYQFFEGASNSSTYVNKTRIGDNLNCGVVAKASSSATQLGYIVGNEQYKDVLSNNFYDYQFWYDNDINGAGGVDVSGGAERKATSALTDGSLLSGSLWAEQKTNSYPIPAAVAQTDMVLVYSSAVVLYDREDASGVLSDYDLQVDTTFSACVANGVTWSDVSIANGETSERVLIDPESGQAQLLSMGRTCLQATKGEASRVVVLWIKDITNSIMTLDGSQFLYTGEAIEPGVKVYYGRSASPENEINPSYYSVSYENNVLVGTATATITGDGLHYVGSQSKTFKINPRNVITKVELTDEAKADSYVSDGTVHTPAVVVSYDRYHVSEGSVVVKESSTLSGDALSDSVAAGKITISYADNIVTGTATITVTGNELDFTLAGAVVSTTFNIISSGNIGEVDASALNFVYDGCEHMPDFGEEGLGGAGTDFSKVVVYDTEGNALSGGYSLAIDTPSVTNAGSYILKVNGVGEATVNKGLGSDVISLLGSVAFTSIYGSKAELKKVYFSVDQSDVVFDGTAHQPEVEVGSSFGVCNPYGLVQDRDYEVSYENNVSAGTAKVVITGKGNFSGRLEYDFAIVKPQVELTATSKTITYGEVAPNGFPCGYEFSATIGGEAVSTADVLALLPDLKCVCAYQTKGDVGSYDITFLNTDVESCEVNAIAGKLTVVRRPLTVTANSVSVVFGDDMPEYTATTDGLQKGDPFVYALECDYVKGTQVKDSPLPITFSSIDVSDNYQLTIVDGVLSIIRKTIEVECPDTVTFTGSSVEPIDFGTLTEGTDYEVHYEANINCGTATYEVTGIGNYDGELSGSFVIAPQDIKLVAGIECADTVVYSGAEQTPVETPVQLVEGVDYHLEYLNNINCGTATYKLIGQGNYSGELTGEFIIAPLDIALVADIACLDTVVYSGDPKTPVAVSGELVKDVDYAVEYQNNVDKGLAKYAITGIGNYTGKVEGSFVISPAQITEEDIVLTGSDTVVYTGSKQDLPFAVVKGGRTLVRFVDYAVTVSDNKDVGTAFVSILGLGNYTGVVIKNFTISPIDIGTADVSVNLLEDNIVYDGTPKNPEVLVSIGDTELVPGADYDIVGYENNTHAGDAKIVIEGKGNYSGRSEAGFSISKALLSVVVQDTVVVYGHQLELKPVVYVGLVAEADIDSVCEGELVCAYAVGTTAGTTMPITAKGYEASDYDMQSVDGELTVLKAPLLLQPRDTAIICGQEIAQYHLDYVGLRAGDDAAAVSDVQVKCDYDSKNCIEGTYRIEVISAKSVNYDVSYGSATLTVEKDTAEQYVVKHIVVNILDRCVFNAELQQPRVEVVYDGSVLTSGEDYEVSYSNNFNATIAGSLATAVIKGLGIYADVDTIKEFVIEQYEFTEDDVAIDGANFSYTGEPVIPTVIVSCANGMQPILGEDYEIEVNNNICHSDTVAPTVVVKGMGNCKGVVEQVFSIEPLVITADMITLSPATCLYDGNPQKPDVHITLDTLSLVEGMDYDLIYYNYVDVGTAYVMVVGKGNCTGTSKVEYKISPYYFSEKHVHLSPSGFTYNGSPQRPQVTIVNDFGTLKEGVDYSLEYLDNVNAGNARVVVSGLGKYAGNEIVTKSFPILQAPLDGSYILEYTSAIYDATPKCPKVSCIEGSATFIAKYDDDCISAGLHSVVVQGTGNYYGNRSMTYSVEKAHVRVIVDDVTITDQDALPTISIVYDGLIEGDDLEAYSTVSLDTSVIGRPGTYSLRLTPSKDNNYDFSYSVSTLRIVSTATNATNSSIKVADGRIYVSGEGETYDYFIYDLKGLLLQKGSGREDTPIDIGGVGRGLLILKVGDGAHLITVK